MEWVIYAGFSVIFFTILSLLQRTIAVDTKYPRAMSMVFNFCAAVVAITIYGIFEREKPISFSLQPQAIIGLLSATFFYAMYERGRFAAAKYLDASTLTTVGNLSVLVATLGAVILYGEKLTLSEIAGGILILAALFLVSGGMAKSVSKKGLVIAITINVLLGLGWMLDKLGVSYFSPAAYNILMWTIPMVFIYLPYIKVSEIKSEAKSGSWKVIVLAGVNVAGYILQLKAMEIAEASKVIPVVQTSTLFTILAGIIILKERNQMWRKLISGLMAITGTFLLV